MSFHRNKIDILFSPNGDIVFDALREDIADTKKIPLRALQQQIENRVFSSKRDWALAPETGADLKRHLGQPNTETTGRQITEALENELVRGGFLKSREFKVKVFPLSKTVIAIYLSIMPQGEPQGYQQVYTFDLAKEKLLRRV